MIGPQQLSILPSNESERWKPVRDDFNFCRLAFFVSGDSVADRFRDIRQEYEVELGGKKFTAVWEVRHDKNLGLPGTFERDVWLGIMEIVQEQTDGGRKPVPDIIEIPSTADFLKRIGKKPSGGNYKVFREAIRRLARTSCWTDRAYNCPTSGGYLQVFKNINLMDEGAIQGEIDGHGNIHERTWIKLSQYVKANLESGYIALLDVAYIRKLKREFAKQLYPFLSYRFWLATQRSRDYVSVHWQELATYLAAVGWSALWRAKQRLQPSITELIERKYLDAESHWEGEYFVFKFGDKFLDELQARLSAKQLLTNWLERKSSAKQLRVLPTITSPRNYEPTPEEERKTVLIREATRIIIGQIPNVLKLAEHAWTVEDAISLSQELKRNTANPVVMS